MFLVYAQLIRDFKKPSHRYHVFVTAGYDNLDHDPSSNTAIYAFHGTAISITQHPEDKNPGIERSIDLYDENASPYVQTLSMSIRLDECLLDIHYIKIKARSRKADGNISCVGMEST